ncbi:unnamed protein product [Parnassius mnemosyne]|uniref:Reverse transcriptase domain-containing protein n=1 Tax=Parnassius mnemosyne TaxID=213953 RepID=A0AAV1K869_9NEOP
MDDLKLFASSRSHLMDLLNITCDFSNSIRMELGTDKCAVLHVERGRVANSEGIDLSMPISVRTLSEAETYRYLGMSQNIGVDEAGMKLSVCDVFYARLTKVLNSLLSGVNKTHAYNGWIMLVLMYTFGMLRGTELNALDRKVRTIMTSHRMHHTRSYVRRARHVLFIRGGAVIESCCENGRCAKSVSELTSLDTFSIKILSSLLQEDIKNPSITVEAKNKNSDSHSNTATEIWRDEVVFQPPRPVRQGGKLRLPFDRK